MTLSTSTPSLNGLSFSLLKMARKRPHVDLTSSYPMSKNRSMEQAPTLITADRLSFITVRTAVDALLKDYVKHENKRARRAVAQGKAGHIVEEESFVTLVVTLKQPPFKEKLRPEAIHLKHSLVMNDDEVLLIVKDPQRLVKDYLAEHGNGGVTRVLGVDKVRKRYGTHEGRRELLRQYDHFLVDKRVAPMMANLLGKPFISAKRMPLAVDMQRNVVSCVERALCSTGLCLRRGTSTSLRVARLEFEAEAIVENIISAVEGVVKKVGGGWDGVQSLIIKSNKSPGLPIYFAMPGLVKGSGGQGEERRTTKVNAEIIEGDSRGEEEAEERTDGDKIDRASTDRTKKSFDGEGKEREGRREGRRGGEVGCRDGKNDD